MSNLNKEALATALEIAHDYDDHALVVSIYEALAASYMDGFKVGYAQGTFDEGVRSVSDLEGAGAAIMGAVREPIVNKEVEGFQPIRSGYTDRT